MEPQKLRYVCVRNISVKPVTLHPRFPQPKKKLKPPSPITLAPDQTSRPMLYDSLVGTKNWSSLVTGEQIGVKDVPWVATFAKIWNISTEPVTFDVELPQKPRDRRKELKRVTLTASETSPPLHLGSITQRRKLKSMAKKKIVSIEPVPYIGPRIADYPSVGSFGYDDVYICYECGGPIVFRYNPPVPIHI